MALTIQERLKGLRVERGNDLILRMYFSNVDKQRKAIEQAPDYIQQAFTSDYGACKNTRIYKAVSRLLP